MITTVQKLRDAENRTFFLKMAKEMAVLYDRTGKIECLEQANDWLKMARQLHDLYE